MLTELSPRADTTHDGAGSLSAPGAEAATSVRIFFARSMSAE